MPTSLYVVTFVIGGFIGVVELLSRYQDSHGSTFKTLWANLYVIINALTALLALYVINAFDFYTCKPDGCVTSDFIQLVILAGVGGMAVLRSSIMKVSVQGREVSVGPAEIIQILLNVADRGTDRARAEDRAATTVKLMGEVSFNKAHEILPATCMALMQNITADEQTLIRNQVDSLNKAEDIPDKVRSILLGLALLPVVGEAGLRAGLSALGDDIRL